MVRGKVSILESFDHMKEVVQRAMEPLDCIVVGKFGPKVSTKSMVSMDEA